MIDIIISNTSNKPIYQQLFEQISSQIIKGELENNFSLPPIRTAAKELRVSIITIKKAWEELEREGFIYSVIGKGCFVSDLSKKDLLKIRNTLIIKKLKKDIEFYKEMDLSVEEMINMINKYY